MTGREKILGDVAEQIASARRVFALTGAGMGVASGLQTFRGANGYWRNRSFEQLASLQGFREDPALVWGWYNQRIDAYLGAAPNAGHHALAEMEELLSGFVLATQNVDGLHARAGSKHPLELHGCIFNVKCTGGCASDDLPIERIDGPFDLKRLVHEGCGGLRRPGVVWFGERLPQGVLLQAMQHSRRAEVIIVAGTSAQVEPAASLARPYSRSTIVVEVNPEPALGSLTPYILAEGTETGLSAIADAVRRVRS